MADAAQCRHDWHWYPSVNEDGWRCVRCGKRPGEPAGYDPRLDRECIDRKVSGLLFDAHHAELVYISNGDHGDYLTASVARACREAGLFDQFTIIAYLLEAMAPSHAEYWRRISDGIVAGKDPRERCHCGALATVFGKAKTCSAHMEW